MSLYCTDGGLVLDGAPIPARDGDVWNLSVWAWCLGTADNHYTVANVVSGGANSECGVEVDSGQQYAYIANGDGAWFRGLPITAGPHHFSFSRIGDFISLAVDGIFHVGQTWLDGVYGEIRVGAGSGGGTLDRFTGYIQDFRVWGGWRSHQTVYRERFRRYPSPDKLVFWMPFQAGDTTERAQSLPIIDHQGTTGQGPDFVNLSTGFRPSRKRSILMPAAGVAFNPSRFFIGG